MPRPLLRAYAEMRPRLEAERFLEAVEIAAIGSGRVKTEYASRVLARAQRRAGTGDAPGAHKPKTFADWAAIPGVQAIKEPARTQ